jgi:hypothetical protein
VLIRVDRKPADQWRLHELRRILSSTSGHITIVVRRREQTIQLLLDLDGRHPILRVKGDSRDSVRNPDCPLWLRLSPLAPLLWLPPPLVTATSAACRSLPRQPTVRRSGTWNGK